MKIDNMIRYRWTALAAIVLALWAFQGCGSAKKESSGSDGSTFTTVSGTTARGSIATINVSTNRNSVKVGDAVLINIIVSCSDAVDKICLRNSSDKLVFYAQPSEFQKNDFNAQQTSLEIPIAYNTSKEFYVGDTSTVSTGSASVTLAAGTRATITGGSLIPGQVLEKATFSASIRAASVGTGVFSVRSFDAVASITIDVFKAATSAITGT